MKKNRFFHKLSKEEIEILRTKISSTNYSAKSSFCRAGITIGSILIDGSISACPNIDSSYVQGNIYQDDFLDVWENRFLPFRDRAWMKQGLCADCKVYKNCLGGAMHLHTKDNGEIMVCHYNKIMGLS